jgi:hypothetical protein
VLGELVAFLLAVLRHPVNAVKAAATLLIPVHVPCFNVIIHLFPQVEVG